MLISYSGGEAALKIRLANFLGGLHALARKFFVYTL